MGTLGIEIMLLTSIEINKDYSTVAVTFIKYLYFDIIQY